MLLASHDQQNSDSDPIYKRYDRNHFYRAKNFYSVQKMKCPDGSSKFVLFHKKNNKLLRVLLNEEMFDAIYSCHSSVGHCGVARTFNNVKERFANVTKPLVELFCQQCPTCSLKTVRMPKQLGAAKPIVSNHFRDRFQVDLINMTSDPQENNLGIVMNYIMTVKDHFTKLTYLAALPNKEPKNVAAELERICGFIGYPLIYQTDNGNEVKAEEILNLLTKINPDILPIQGRPRTPSDQGSVEVANRAIENVLASLCDAERKLGNQPNWTWLLGRTMASINCGRNSGDGEVSSYELVFGMKFHEPTQCLDDLPNAWKEFNAKHDDKPMTSKQLAQIRCQDPGVCIRMLRLEEVDEQDLADAMTKLDMEDNSTRKAGNEDFAVPTTGGTNMVNTISTLTENTQPSPFNSKILCLKCSHNCYTTSSDSDTFILTMTDHNHLSILENDQRHWQHDILNTFACLKSHKKHLSGVTYIRMNNPDDMDAVKLSFAEGIHTAFSIVHKLAHFALVEIQLDARAVRVYDGLFRKASWMQHINVLITMCGLDPEVFSVEDAQDCPRQFDSVSCGPLACANLWNILDPEGGIDVENIHTDSNNTVHCVIAKELRRLMQNLPLEGIEEPNRKTKSNVTNPKVVDILEEGEAGSEEDVEEEAGELEDVIVLEDVEEEAGGSDVKVANAKVLIGNNNIEEEAVGSVVGEILLDRQDHMLLDCDKQSKQVMLAGKEKKEEDSHSTTSPTINSAARRSEEEASSPAPFLPRTTPQKEEQREETQYQWSLLFDSTDENSTSGSDSDRSEEMPPLSLASWSDRGDYDSAAVAASMKSTKTSNENKRKRVQTRQAEKMKRYRGLTRVEVKRGDIICVKVDPRDANNKLANRLGVLCVALDVKKETGGCIAATEVGTICTMHSKGQPPLYIPYARYSTAQNKKKSSWVLSKALRTLQEKVLQDPMYQPDTKISMKQVHSIVHGGKNDILQRLSQSKKAMNRTSDNGVGRKSCACKKDGCKSGKCGCRRRGVNCSKLCGCLGNCYNAGGS